jgi:quinol-cytochrome oxidoreductase complex cytochrome b subunit
MSDRTNDTATNDTASNDTPQSAAARLFDIRVMIGGLFVVYGVMLTVAGFTTTDKERAKAAGININLWLGICMLVLGGLFLLWFKLRPLRHESPDDGTDVDTSRATP